MWSHCPKWSVQRPFWASPGNETGRVWRVSRLFASAFVLSEAERIPHQTLTAGKTKRVATIRWETQSEQRPNDYVQTTETTVAWWYVILISNANCSNLRTCRFFFDCGCFHFHLGLSPSKQQNCKRLRCRWIEQESFASMLLVLSYFLSNMRACWQDCHWPIQPATLRWTASPWCCYLHTVPSCLQKMFATTAQDSEVHLSNVTWLCVKMWYTSPNSHLMIKYRQMMIISSVFGAPWRTVFPCDLVPAKSRAACGSLSFGFPGNDRWPQIWSWCPMICKQTQNNNMYICLYVYI